MLEVRQMTASNVHEAILPLGHEFEKVIDSPLVRIVDEIFVKNWRQYIEIGVGVVLAMYDDEAPIGVLAAFVSPDSLNGELRAQEAWFYVKPTYRGVGSMLLKAFENLARGRGVKTICFGRLHHLDPKVAEFYKKNGYEEFETWSFKELV